MVRRGKLAVLQAPTGQCRQCEGLFPSPADRGFGTLGNIVKDRTPASNYFYVFSGHFVHHMQSM